MPARLAGSDEPASPESGLCRWRGVLGAPRPGPPPEGLPLDSIAPGRLQGRNRERGRGSLPPARHDGPMMPWYVSIVWPIACPRGGVRRRQSPGGEGGVARSAAAPPVAICGVGEGGSGPGRPRPGRSGGLRAGVPAEHQTGALVSARRRAVVHQEPWPIDRPMTHNVMQKGRSLAAATGCGRCSAPGRRRKARSASAGLVASQRSACLPIRQRFIVSGPFYRSRGVRAQVALALGGLAGYAQCARQTPEASGRSMLWPNRLFTVHRTPRKVVVPGPHSTMRSGGRLHGRQRCHMPRQGGGQFRQVLGPGQPAEGLLRQGQARRQPAFGLPAVTPALDPVRHVLVVRERRLDGIGGLQAGA